MTDFTHDEIIDFIYAEARMLDEGRYDEWLELWLDDAHYWMPLEYKQDDPHLTTSLLYEDSPSVALYCVPHDLSVSEFLSNPDHYTTSGLPALNGGHAPRGVLRV